jgi:hypothetical protein
MPRKRSTGENERETLLGVGNIGNHTIDPGVGCGDEWFLHQADAGVIEDPRDVCKVK